MAVIHLSKIHLNCSEIIVIQLRISVYVPEQKKMIKIWKVKLKKNKRYQKKYQKNYQQKISAENYQQEYKK